MKMKNSLPFCCSVAFYTQDGGRPGSAEIMHTEKTLLLMESQGLIMIIHNITSYSMGASVSEFTLN